MKFCFTVLSVVFCAFCACVASAGSIGEDTTSVLVAPQSAAVVVVAPAAKSDCACSRGDCSCKAAAPACSNGQCTKLYSAETKESEHCRNRLFGGTVARKNARTVVRPVRR